MAYDTFIEMYQGTPFDTGHKHTLMPAGTANKRNWIKNNCSYRNFSDIMMIKMDYTTGYGVVRLGVPGDEAPGYNYCFVTPSAGWSYFAHVLGCAYINDGGVVNGAQWKVYEFTLKLDPVMTYLIDSDQLIEAPITRHTATANFTNAYGTEPFQGGKMCAWHKENLQFEGGSANDAILYVIKAIVSKTIVNNTYTPLGPNGENAVITKQESKEEITITASEHQGVCDACYCFVVGNATRLQAAAEALQRAGGRIIDAYTVPKWAVATSGTVHIDTETLELLASSQTNATKVIAYRNIGYDVDAQGRGYTPHNKKCSYYPYYFTRIVADNGQYMDLKYEDWMKCAAIATPSTSIAAGQWALGAVVCVNNPVMIDVYPIGYDGNSRTVQSTIDGVHCAPPDCAKKITISGLPSCGIAESTYAQKIGSGEIAGGLGGAVSGAVDNVKAYFGDVMDNPANLLRAPEAVGTTLGKFVSEAVNSNGKWISRSLVPALIGGAGSLIGAATSGADSLSMFNGGAVKGTSGAAELYNSAVSSRLEPPTVQGSGSSTASYVSRGKFRPTAITYGLRTGDLKALDTTFDRFGYGQNGVVAKPDPTGRDRYCFVQTAGDCFVPHHTGGTIDDGYHCSANMAAEVNEAFMSGIMFWSHSNTLMQIGQYGNNGADPILWSTDDNAPFE